MSQQEEAGAGENFVRSRRLAPAAHRRDFSWQTTVGSRTSVGRSGSETGSFLMRPHFAARDAAVKAALFDYDDKGVISSG